MTAADLKHGLDLMRQASRATEDFDAATRSRNADPDAAARHATDCEYRLMSWLREHGENLFAAAGERIGVELK